MTIFGNPLADSLGTRRGTPLVRGSQFENRWSKELQNTAFHALLIKFKICTI